MTDSDVHGPIDFVLLEFPRDRLSGEAARALADLIERGVVRVYDLMVISKNEDGTVEVLELGETATGAATFGYFADARSGLLGDEDVAAAAGAMEPDTVAALIVYENTWAIPFVAAVRDNGGELVASARIPAADVMATLDALEPTS
jgi:dihydroorotase-like cyclic amidohydrolase